tara:strand:+ start:2366 stop:3106 length:741 start_codon:yes stop_codon:yes gene_type:complete
MSLVSIIIPYYKKKLYIEEAINSAIGQTFQDIEIIIVFDDPEGNDLPYIKKISKKDERIKLIVNDKNIGAGNSRNIGILRSSGQYIAFLDSDDLWSNNKIETQLKFMRDNKSNFSHTSYEVLNKDLKLNIRKARNFDHLRDLLKSCDIGLSTVMLKKELITSECQFSDMSTKEDFVLWLKLLKSGIRIQGIDSTLSTWRETDDSLSSSINQKMKDGFNVYYKHMNFNFFKSLFYLICLSVNYIKKS